MPRLHPTQRLGRHRRLRLYKAIQLQVQVRNLRTLPCLFYRQRARSLTLYRLCHLRNLKRSTTKRSDQLSTESFELPTILRLSCNLRANRLQHCHPTRGQS